MNVCPVCDGRNLVDGRLLADLGGVGFRTLDSKKPYSLKVIACKDCGSIISIKVEKPERL